MNLWSPSCLRLDGTQQQKFSNIFGIYKNRKRAFEDFFLKKIQTQSIVEENIRSFQKNSLFFAPPESPCGADAHGVPGALQCLRLPDWTGPQPMAETGVDGEVPAAMLVSAEATSRWPVRGVVRAGWGGRALSFSVYSPSNRYRHFEMGREATCYQVFGGGELFVGAGSESLFCNQTFFVPN